MKIKVIAAAGLMLFCSTIVFAQPRVLRRLHYRMDTLHFYGQNILLQRYSEADLNRFFAGDVQTGNMARALVQLQRKLEVMRQDVQDNKVVGGVAAVQVHLDDISSSDPGFDLGNYLTEYRFYKRYIPVVHQAESRPADGQEIMAEWRRLNKIIAAEDPDVITEFDRRIASNEGPNYFSDVKDPSLVAWEKIQHVEYMQRQREHDSEVAARERMQWEKHEKFLKDFAAKQKKNFTKAFGPAVAAKLLQRKLWIGMSMAMVDSMFLWPDDETRTTTREGITITWFFKGDPGGPIRPDFDTWLVFDANTKKLIAIEE